MQEWHFVNAIKQASKVLDMFVVNYRRSTPYEFCPCVATSNEISVVGIGQKSYYFRKFHTLIKISICHIYEVRRYICLEVVTVIIKAINSK